MVFSMLVPRRVPWPVFVPLPAAVNRIVATDLNCAGDVNEPPQPCSAADRPLRTERRQHRARRNEHRDHRAHSAHPQGERTGSIGCDGEDKPKSQAGNPRRRRRKPALAALVRQSGQSRHDRALSRALSQLRPDQRRSFAPASRSSASRRPAPTCRPATAIISNWPSACARASATPAASPSSSPAIRSRRPASGRPRRSTATSPISAWSRCCTAIRSTAWC